MEILPAMFDTGGNPIILPLFCRKKNKKKLNPKSIPSSHVDFPSDLGPSSNPDIFASGNPSLWASYDELLPALHGKSLETLADQFQSRADIQALQDSGGDPEWQIMGKWHGKPWETGGKPWINSIKDGVSPVDGSMKSSLSWGFWFFLHGKHGLRLWLLKMRSSCRFTPLKPILAVLVIVDEWGRTAHVWK